MIDMDKIKKIRFAKKEEELERSIEKVRVESQMEMDALKKQVEKLQSKLDTANNELIKEEIKAEEKI